MKSEKTPFTKSIYQNLLNKISQRYIERQTHAVLSVNENIINTNCIIGKYIIEYEQGEKKKEKYSNSGSTHAA